MNLVLMFRYFKITFFGPLLFLECSSDKDCKQAYSTCYKGICKCKDELITDGKTCKPGKDVEKYCSAFPV